MNSGLDLPCIVVPDKVLELFETGVINPVFLLVNLLISISVIGQSFARKFRAIHRFYHKSLACQIVDYQPHFPLRLPFATCPNAKDGIR